MTFRRLVRSLFIHPLSALEPAFTETWSTTASTLANPSFQLVLTNSSKVVELGVSATRIGNETFVNQDESCGLSIVKGS